MAVHDITAETLVGSGQLSAHAVVTHSLRELIVGDSRIARVLAEIRPANDDEPRLKSDTAAAISFLEHFAPDSPWVLTAIDSDKETTKKPTDTHVFHPSAGADRAKQATAWIESYQGRWNIYFTPNNRVNDAWLSRKPRKVGKPDIDRLTVVHVDVDPRKGDGYVLADEQERIRNRLMGHQPPFDVIVFSGGGYQAFYLLKEPVPAVNLAKVEVVNKRLEKALAGATQCWDVSHIMRLPGTINMPNKGKRDNGRVPALAELVAVPGDWERRYTFADLQAAAEDWGDDEPAPEPPKPGASFIDTLPISDRMRDLIRGIDDPKHPYPSRSERVMAVMVAMVGAGCIEDTIRAVFLDPQYPISAHVLEKRNFARQLHKARQAVLDPDVRELNKTYAVVLVGGRAAIIKEVGNPELCLISTEAFHTWFGNRIVMEGKKQVTLAKHWLNHPLRRQYEGIVFAPKREVPDHYNLWRGFAVEPKAGDCGLFLDHIRDVACCGIDAHYHWVMTWLAQIVQHPDVKMGTSVVFRGKRGTGKTIIGEIIRPLLGPHYYRVAEPRYITGQFNSHLIACLLLHADEGFWAGDHQAESKLKDLITSDEQMIEFKNKEPIRVRNYVRLLVTGNANWIVPAGMEERRFAVFDMADTHQEDHAYFGAMLKQMEHGGYAALLHHLLHYDCSGINLRTIPKTGALLDQKLASLSPENGWWADVLRSGRLPHGCGVPNMTPSSLLFDSYVQHANKTGVRRRAIETQIGMYLIRIVGADLLKTKATYRNYKGYDEVGTVYTLPPLAQCRARFAAELHQEIEWGSVTDWLPAPQWRWRGAWGQCADANEREGDPPF
jgi:hypothetical protein